MLPRLGGPFSSHFQSKTMPGWSGAVAEALSDTVGPDEPDP